jgi:hypothetical protein
LAIYAVLAVAVYWPIGPVGSDRIVTCGCGDIALQAWFLAWPAHALTHALNPLYSDYINVPDGVNSMSNTSMPLLGMVATPFTLALGAVATFNLFMQLSFFASAASMFLVLRRWTTWWPATFVGGLLYGFSPYMLGEGNGHLHVLFVALPPLILAVLDDLLIRRHWSARRAGLLLGLLAGMQLLISSEVLADTALMTVIGVVILAARHPHAVRARAARVAAAGAWALVPFALLTGYPIWFSLAGPQHVTGPWGDTSIYKADLLGPIVPTVSQLLGGSHWRSLGDSFSGRDIAENGIYLGVPLVVLCIVVAVAGRRNGVVRFSVIMAGIAFLLSLGGSLVVDGHRTGIPLPFELLHHLPLFKQEIAARYSLYVQLFVSMTAAVGINELRKRALAGSTEPGARHRLHATRRSRPRWLINGTLVLVMVVALVPLIPHLPYPTPSPGIPSYFTSTSPQDVRAIAPGSVVLTYPYPFPPQSNAMLWQAEAGMRFRIIGDYAITPLGNGSGDGTLAPPTLPPSLMETLFLSAYQGGPGVAGLPPPDASTLSQLRAFIVRYQVGTVLVVPSGGRPDIVTHYLTAALGRPPAIRGGVEVWPIAPAR